MSNSTAPGPRRRRRGGLVLPRSAWPIMYGFAATAGLTEVEVEEAIRAAADHLASRLTGATRRSEVRAMTLDAMDCEAVLADLQVDPGGQPELRAFCREHPGGRLVVVWADYEPSTRRTTILGGG